MLGFEEVRAIDPNFDAVPGAVGAQHVVSINRYRQDHPFVGMPATTEKWVVDGPYVPSPCQIQGPEIANGGAASECFSAGSGIAFPRPSQPSARLISFAAQDYDQRTTVTGLDGTPVRFSYATGTFDAVGDTSYAAGVAVRTLSETATSFLYDDWGNITSTSVAIAAGRDYDRVEPVPNAGGTELMVEAFARASLTGSGACGGACIKSTTTTSTYMPADVAYWRHARLERAVVQHSRPGAPDGATRTRTSAFAYDMASSARTGLLTRETIEPDGASTQKLTTTYVHDRFGNVEYTLTCSGDVPQNACDGPEDVSGFLQRPATSDDRPLTQIKRYTRTEYDANRRFALRKHAPLFDGAAGGTQARESVIEEVLERDVRGNVLLVADARGAKTRTVIGAMDRVRSTAVQTNESADESTWAGAATELMWCRATIGSAGVACPQSAAFRERKYTRGGARTEQYYDVLGRPFFTLVEGFNNGTTASNNDDWSATCTYHDARGRVVRATTPFFVPGTPESGTSSTSPTIVDGGTPCGSAPSGTRTAYDALDRPVQILMPEHTPGSAAASVMAYTGVEDPTAVGGTRYRARTTTTTTVSRAVGTASPTAVTTNLIEDRDATGQKVRVVDHDGLVARYEVDATDNLVRLLRWPGAEGDASTAIVNGATFDHLGRRTAQNDPDAGASAATYNAAGEVVCEERPFGASGRAHTITDRDILGRVWRTRSMPGACPTPSTQAPIAVTSQSAFDNLALTAGASRTVDLTVYDIDEQAAGGAMTHQRNWGLATRIARRQTVGVGYAVIDSYSRRVTYDNLGRPTTAATSIAAVAGGTAETRSETTVYDALGRVLTMSDATGGLVEHMYSRHGALRRVRDGANLAQVYWELLEADVRGQPMLDRKHGNVEITTQRQYDATSGRLQAIRSGSWVSGAVVSPVQDLRYLFDALGNLTSRQDHRVGARVAEDFAYDNLNRLVSGTLRALPGGSVSGQASTISLEYDRLGNICTKNGRQYQYDGRSGCARALNGATSSPHAVTALFTSAGALDRSYAYDAAGNQTLRDIAGTDVGDRRIRYDINGAPDRIAVGPASVPTELTSFRNGPTGRYVREDGNGTAVTTTTRYYGSVEWITRQGSAQVERKRYIGGFLILVETGDLSAPVRKHNYQLTDHLGSLDVLVDESGRVLRDAQGNEIGRYSFDAHGSRRAVTGSHAWQAILANVPTPVTPRGFTGHEHVDSAGIIHMNGRLYDPELGRMLSPDPLVQEPFNAQNLNRYTYVLNNPLSYTDPTGMSFFRKYWRTIVAIAVTIAVPANAGLVAKMLAGFVSGAVQSGSLEGGLKGAFQAAVFHGIGEAFGDIASANAEFNVEAIKKGSEQLKLLENGLTHGQNAAKILAHATAGGVMHRMQDGKFGSGFVSAGFTEAVSVDVMRIDSRAGQTVVGALVGGVSSVASGGKFANGAVTAAFARAVGEVAGGRQAQQVGDEPQNISDAVRVNRGLRDNISVACAGSDCDVSMRLSIGGDATVTDETVAWAARDIRRSWQGGYVYGDRSYRVSVDVSIVDRSPDILIAAVRPQSNWYPGGQAFVGRGNVLELGRYGPTVAAHELGHLMGLSHQPNFTSSIMSYSPISHVTGMDVDRVARAYGGR